MIVSCVRSQFPLHDFTSVKLMVVGVHIAANGIPDHTSRLRPREPAFQDPFHCSVPNAIISNPAFDAALKVPIPLTAPYDLSPMNGHQNPSGSTFFPCAQSLRSGASSRNKKDALRGQAAS